MIKIIEYHPHLNNEWNRIVNESKNGTFILNRNYMDYHKDRFDDKSLMFLKADRYISLIPVNTIGKSLQSHGGLTYGGLIYGPEIGTKFVLDIFDQMVKYYRENGFQKILYKPTPYIYHDRPADEVLYALFLSHAKLIRREISTVINLNRREEIISSRKRQIRKGNKLGMQVSETQDYVTYWKMLSDNLMRRYNRSPVHSVEEIVNLKNAFPQNIRLLAAFEKRDMVAGVVSYESKTTAHLQYIANSDSGKEIGALDILIAKVIEIYRQRGFNFLDFGISTERGGDYLNEGLIFYKESFGGSGVTYDSYEVDLEC